MFEDMSRNFQILGILPRTYSYILSQNVNWMVCEWVAGETLIIKNKRYVRFSWYFIFVFAFLLIEFHRFYLLSTFELYHIFYHMSVPPCSVLRHLQKLLETSKTQGDTVMCPIGQTSNNLQWTLCTTGEYVVNDWK